MAYEVKNAMLERVCKRYNASIGNAEYLDNIIIIPVKKGSLYLIFDKNCNILGIDSYDNSGSCKSKEEFFEKKYNNSDGKEDNIFLDMMNGSFDYSSLSMIQNISNNTYFSTKYCFYKGEMVSDKYLEELISYFAFLGKEIKYYSQIELCMKKMGYDAPDIPIFLNAIMVELDNYINNCTKLNMIPLVDEFIYFIGQGDLEINKKILKNIFNYSLRDKGYEMDCSTNHLVMIDDELDLDILSKKFIKMMK